MSKERVKLIMQIVDGEIKSTIVAIKYVNVNYIAQEMFPLIFFQCAQKSIVFARHIFMPERLNFFHCRCHPRQQRNQSHL